MAEDYQDDKPMNFNYRFKVETNMGSEGVVDHREGFAQHEYQRSCNGVYQTPEGSQLTDIKRGERSKVKQDKPQPKRQSKKTSNDAALKAANTKDLKKRNLRNS